MKTHLSSPSRGTYDAARYVSPTAAYATPSPGAPLRSSSPAPTHSADTITSLPSRAALHTRTAPLSRNPAVHALTSDVVVAVVVSQLPLPRPLSLPLPVVEKQE